MSQTGAYEFELLQAVKHDNAELFVIDDTENLLQHAGQLHRGQSRIEDKDCDVHLHRKVIVSIDDDMPVITECYERGNLIVNGSFEDLGKRKTAASWTRQLGRVLADPGLDVRRCDRQDSKPASRSRPTARFRRSMPRTASTMPNWTPTP